MMENAKKELIDRIVLKMSSMGCDAQDSKLELSLIFKEYEITKAETSLVVYQGDPNMAYLRKFLAAKTVAGRTQRTINQYHRRASFVFSTIGKCVTDITPDDLLIYFAGRMKAGVKKVTIDNDRLILSSFFQWLVQEEVITKNPVAKVDKIKYQSEKKEAFSEYEIELLRANIRNNRERAIFETLLSTGCRISELTSIRIPDIKDDSINILGKGEKYRTVYLNAKAILAIQQYLAERSDTNPYLFPKSTFVVGSGLKPKSLHEWYKRPDLTHPTDRIDKGSIEATIRKLGNRAGVPKAHPHRFRRTCATLAMRRGMPIELVSKMLGHSNLDTTKIYLDISETDLQNAHKKYVSQ